MVAVPLGVIAAWKQGTWIDRFVMALSVLGFSVQVLVIGYVLIKLFAIDLRWVPVQGFRSITLGFGPFFERIILPTIALSFIYIALIARMTRASMLDVLGEDYVRTARAKGLSPARVIGLHALRNAMIPIITVIGLMIGSLFAGAVQTETVFSWPGVGKWLIDSFSLRDYPALQGGILIIAIMVTFINLGVDLLYGVINPRIRHGRA